MGTLTVLQDIRDGKIDAATSRLESLCYSSAITLLRSRQWRHAFVMETLRPELIEYRRKYAKPEAEWTPAEQMLERLLKQEQ